ncbi:MAG: PQQ-binding-like beta-propeller repeat protein [Fimbriimonadaceae bacterium]|nr:PQQ-binding-like beta-propeller repeat protein [Fimbriimonadaceae bacterium]
MTPFVPERTSRRGRWWLAVALLLVFGGRTWWRERQPVAAAWWVAVGDAVRLTPVLLGDRLVVAPDDRHLLGLTAADGRLLWDILLSAPAVALATSSQTAFVATAEGRVLALDCRGELRWRQQLDRRAVRQLAATDRLVAVVDGAGALWGIDPANGLPRWRRPADPPPCGLWLDRQQLLVTWPDGRVVRHNLDGLPRWATQPTAAARLPLVVGDSVWVARDDGRVNQLALANGAVRGERLLGAGVTAWAPLGQRVLALLTDGRVVALASGATAAWELRLPAPGCGPGAVLGDTMVIACTDGQLRAVDAAGVWRWRLSPGATVTAGLMAGDGALFLASWAGEVGALRVR